MDDEEEVQPQEEEHTVSHTYTYALVQRSTLSEEDQSDVNEVITTAVEKFVGNNEAAARYIKEEIDKKSGAMWHVVVGEGYGFEVTMKMNRVHFMYIGGNLAVCMWQCS